MREEAWGLLFYSQIRHRLFFARSKDWLAADCFDGTRDFAKIVDDVCRRCRVSPPSVERSLGKLIPGLVQSGMIITEQ